MRFLIMSAVLCSALACDEMEPCEDYIDYMCACHEAEADFSCAELEQTLSEAEPDVQSQCAIDLVDQQDEDEVDGLECATL
jgi:hypothetical protein